MCKFKLKLEFAGALKLEGAEDGLWQRRFFRQKTGYKSARGNLVVVK